jgi:hypothetical protein
MENAPVMMDWLAMTVARATEALVKSPSQIHPWGFSRFEVSVRPGVSTLAIAVPPLGRWMSFFKRLRVLEPSLRH